MGEDSEYYWEIIERDGTVTSIPPTSVEVVRKRLGNGDPINMSTRSIPAHQVVKFQITGQVYNPQPLIEDVSRAFHEPIYIGKSVAGRWVKKMVTMTKWDRYYSAIPSYRFLRETNGMAEIACVIAIHDIDLNKTPYCTNDEIALLTKSN